MESLILRRQIEAYEEQAMAEKPKDVPKGMEGLASKQSEMLKSTSGMMRACIEQMLDEDNSFLQFVELPHKSYKRLMAFFWKKMMPFATKTPGMNSNLYTGMVYGEGSIYDFLSPIVREYYELDDKKEVEKELEKEIKEAKAKEEAEAKRKEEAERRKEMSDKADAEALAFFIEKHGVEPTEEEKKDYKGDYSEARRKAMIRLQDEESARKKKEAAERAKAKRAEEKAKENALMEELAAIENDDERQIRIDSLADERFFATVKGAADMEEDEQDAKTEEIKAKIEKAVEKIRKGTAKGIKKATVKKPVEDTQRVNLKNEARTIAKAYIYSLGDEKYPMLSDKDRAIAEIEPTILKRLENGESKEQIEAILYCTNSEEQIEESTTEFDDSIDEMPVTEEVDVTSDVVDLAEYGLDISIEVLDFVPRTETEEVSEGIEENVAISEDGFVPATETPFDCDNSDDEPMETEVEEVESELDKPEETEVSSVDNSNIVEFKKPEKTNDDEYIRAAVEKQDKQMSIFDFL